MEQLAKRRGALAVLLVSLAAPLGSEAEEAWGYLWTVRTMQLYPLTEDLIRVGRQPGSHIILTHPMVSRRHVEIRKTTDGATIADLHSTNGTHVNRRALRAGQESPLGAGDLLTLAEEELLFDWTKEGLFEESLRHALLARLVVLRVPALQDRTIRALGTERRIEGRSEAAVDLDQERLRMSYANETEAQAFEPGEKALVGDVAIAEGGLRLSLWGVSREAPLQSRRAAYSQLVHGELLVGLAGSSPEAARANFESRWAEEGMRFITPLLFPVMEIYSEAQSAESGLKVARGLADLSEPVALKDGARCLAFLYRLDPTDAELPVHAARAEARWVKAMAAANQSGLDELQRSELVAALERGKGLVRTAGELGANETKEVEAEIVEAEGMLGKVP